MDTLRSWLPGVSKSKVAEVCERLQALDGPVTRRHLQAAQGRLLEPCIRTLRVRGTELDVEVLDLQRAVTTWLQHSEEARQLWSRSVASASGEPWRMVLGWDEFDPGKALIGFHSRKVMLLDATFLEFGRKALRTDACWLTLACKPADISHEPPCFSQLQSTRNIHLARTEQLQLRATIHCTRVAEWVFGLCAFVLNIAGQGNVPRKSSKRVLYGR